MDENRGGEPSQSLVAVSSSIKQCWQRIPFSVLQDRNILQDSEAGLIIPLAIAVTLILSPLGATISLDTHRRLKVCFKGSNDGNANRFAAEHLELIQDAPIILMPMNPRIHLIPHEISNTRMPFVVFSRQEPVLCHIER